MIYWDTCCVLKLFVQETDSQRWVDQALSQQTPLHISQLTRAEVNFALRAKETRKEITVGGATFLGKQFENDIRKGLFHVSSLSASIIDRSIQFARNSQSYPLRTLDGLHLATAIETGCTAIASTDKKFLEIAVRLGFDALEL